MSVFVTRHTQLQWGKVIGIGVHIYIYIIMYIHVCLWTNKNLNHTLDIDIPFQTFAVGLLVDFID